MTTGDLIVIAVLALIIVCIVAGMHKDKKNGKMGCSGCPNYGNCRAHIGCTNNPNNKTKPPA